MGICDSLKENNNFENKDNTVDYISNKDNNTKGNNDSIIEINKYLSEISRVVCQIQIEGEEFVLEKGSGFFLKFSLEKNELEEFL